MNEPNLLYVVPDGRTGWAIQLSKRGRALAHFATLADAEIAACRLIANQGGGEVRLEIPDGRGALGERHAVDGHKGDPAG